MFFGVGYEQGDANGMVARPACFDVVGHKQYDANRVNARNVTKHKQLKGTVMVICKTGKEAFVGATAADAYRAYLNDSDESELVPPSDMEWYSATQMAISMTLAAKPKGKDKAE